MQKVATTIINFDSSESIFIVQYIFDETRWGHPVYKIQIIYSITGICVWYELLEAEKEE